MKKTLLTAAILACLSARAALPSLTDLAETIAAIRERLAESTNWQANAESRIEEFRERLDALRAGHDSVLVVIEADKNLRERYHGGRIAQYILTNDVGRIIRVDLYGDGSSWTNGATYAVNPLADPEERTKALAEAAARAAEARERAQAAWEAANLPADLAALRARQREAARNQGEE